MLKHVASAVLLAVIISGVASQTPIPLSAADQNEIAQAHNYVRRRVVPTAANMEEMVGCQFHACSSLSTINAAILKLLFHAIGFACSILFVFIFLLSTISCHHLQTYNAELSGIAQEYSLRCQFEHSNNDRSPSFSTIGENIFLGQGVAVNYTNFIVDSWSNSESINYDFESNTCRRPPCGHYTQVSAKSTLYSTSND